MTIEDVILALVGAIISGLIKEIPTEGAKIPALVEQIVADFRTAHPEIGAAPPDPEKSKIDAAIDAELAKLS